VRPDRVTRAHDELSELAGALTGQVKDLRSVSESLLRKHGKGIVAKQFQLKRVADAVSDIYAQIAVLSRVTAIFDEHGVEPSGQERFIAETFCKRAASRVHGQFNQIDHNDDERVVAISKLAYKRGSYGYAFFDD
jgi:acyl-CoA dehydrogenase family protein 9